jgi:hypothetical protein
LTDDDRGAAEEELTVDEFHVVEGAEDAGDAGGDEDVEYEYVYEDEHGNPIAAPETDLHPDHYEEEVLEVVEEDGAQGAGEGADAEALAAAGAATVNIAPEEKETRRVRSGSTRRATGRRSRGKGSSGRVSGRSRRLGTGEVDPVALKHAKIKTLLMVGSLALIPILIVAIILTYCYKRGLLFWKKQQVQTVAKNPVDRGKDLRSEGFRAMHQGRKLMDEGKDDEAYHLLTISRDKLENATKLMMDWREKNQDKGYSYIDEYVADMNIKLRAVREYLFQIEMRRARNGRK